MQPVGALKQRSNKQIETFSLKYLSVQFPGVGSNYFALDFIVNSQQYVNL